MAKALPVHREAEQWVLGGLIADPVALVDVGQVLTGPEYFYYPKHKILYQVFLDMAMSNEVIDLITLADELLKRRGITKPTALEEIGGRVYMVELVEGVSSLVNILKWAELVREKYLYRTIIERSQVFSESAYNQKEPPIVLMASFSQEMLNLSRQKEDRSFCRVGSYMPDLLMKVESLKDNKGRVIGLPFYYKDLDQRTGGSQKGDLVIISGRPGMGKTALMDNSSSKQAAKGHNVGVFSSETRGEEYSLRTLCKSAQLDSMEVRRGIVGDWDHVTKTADEIAEWEYWIDDTPSIEINSLIAKATQLKQEKDVDAIYVDYIQKLTVAQKFNSLREKTTYIAQSLKHLAQTLEIPVIALSQLSRAVETRQNKRPILSDLKESGDIEQEADLILGLYRPELYIGKKKKDEGKYKNLCICIIMKQRNGPTGDINLFFNPVYTRFENWLETNPELPY